MSTKAGQSESGARAPRERRRVERTLLYLAFLVAILYTLFPPIAMAADTVGANIAGLIAVLAGGNTTLLEIGGSSAPKLFYFTAFYYQQALALTAFPSRALNSLVIAAVSVGAALAVGVPVSYVLARVEIKGKKVVSAVLLALRTISPFAVVLPLYIFFSKVGLWNTYQGVALAELIFVLAVVVWMVKGFFADIPKQVYDAASVFATSEGQVFRRVALPLVAGGVVITAIFGVVLVWNEFLISAVLAGPQTKSVAVGVWTGLGEANSSPSFTQLETGATLVYVPALAVMLAIRKYLAKGFSLGTAR